MTEAVSSTNRCDFNGVSITSRDDHAVTRPGDIGGSGLSLRPSWSFSTVFRTLPPLASVQPEPVTNDPAATMLAAVKAAGGCLEIPEGGYAGRWVVLCSEGAALRFPSPVGHRLASQGLICRHPSDVPGEERRFVRFVPREQMPAGFEFKVSNVDTARHYDSKIKQFTQEEYLAHMAVIRGRQQAKKLLQAGGAL